MRIFQRRKPRTMEEQEATAVKDFFDQLLPGAIRFYPDSCVCGNTWRSVWAVKEYPPSTEEQAILSQLADRSHVTLRIYNRLVDSAEQRIFEIRQGRESRGLQRIDEIIIETYDRLQKLSSADREQYLGIPTGFTMLDQITTGLNKTDLIFIAARPGMGKTAFALNIATHVAKLGKKVAIFNLEMSRDQLVGRILSGEARIPGNALRTGNLSGDDWNRLAEAAGYLSQAQIYIDDATGISPGEIKARLRRMKDLDLVIIDYLQLMTSGRRIDNRVQEVSEMTRALKVMAKELRVPVITLSQLSRGPESRRDNHRPMLSDLRESGSIEQDADAVWFLYRDAYYNKESEEQNIAECIVAKNRHGETDTVKLAWDGAYTRFSNLEMYRNEE